MSAVFFVGEPINVPEDIQVTIDCSPLIDQALMEGAIFNITWRKDGRPISNGSEINVVLSPDRRVIIITETLLGTPAQVGNVGTYECEVCGAECIRNETIRYVCCKYVT